MKPRESRLNSRITPVIRAPFGPGGRAPLFAFRPADMMRASSLIDGFDFTAGSFQQIGIDARLAVRDDNRADGLLVKLDRSGAANDAVDIT